MTSEITVPLATTTIAGIKFRPKEQVQAELAAMEPGTLMVLVPEPTNKYDPHAIRIVSPERTVECPDNPDTSIDVGGVFLGYVPRSINQVVADYMQPPKRIEVRFMEKGSDLVNIIGFEPGS